MPAADNFAWYRVVLRRVEVVKKPLVDLEFLGIEVQDLDDESPVGWPIIDSERSKGYSLPTQGHISQHVWIVW